MIILLLVYYNRQNLLNDPINILKKDKRLFVDGELLKIRHKNWRLLMTKSF